MKKLLFGLVLALGLMAFVGNGSEAKAASAGDTTLRHAYKPYTVDTTRAMRARVDNFGGKQERLVCVEAFRTDNGRKTHLGCLKLSFADYNSAESWAQEFDAPTYLLKTGTYRVVYTYQAADGSWHKILSTTLKVMDGEYRAW